jgi:uncharacterized protein YcfJ
MILSMMKKCFIWAMGALLVLSSCQSYTAAGAYTGAQFGNVIGSAIGGISGGWRGHHQGRLIGTIGGAVAGAAIGAAVENAENRKVEEAMERRAQARSGINQRDYEDSGFDPQGRGDDRITFDEGPAVSGERSVSVTDLIRKAPIELRNAEIYDANGDGILTRGEQCTVSFEIMNNTDNVIYDLMPMVEDVTGNRHVNISPNLRVESINPRQGIRYTATILADKRLKDGEIMVRVGVMQGQQEVTSQTLQLRIQTRKKR